MNGPPDKPTVVLDTNVVLAWLVFREPHLASAFDASITAGRTRWIASEAMRDEFTDVLQRGLAERVGVGLAAALSGWRHAILLPAAAPAQRWRCRDADDQKFVDLSIEHGASWLLTRDRDLLALGRRSRAHGLMIAPPDAWLATCGA
jgi:putative PIN family toxin of toxin-antitoxin system